MDEIPSELNSVPSYYFETPDSDPDPELLKLLPEKSLFEQVLDFGLYFVAAFQVRDKIARENILFALIFPIFEPIINFTRKIGTECKRRLWNAVDAF